MRRETNHPQQQIKQGITELIGFPLMIIQNSKINSHS